MGGVRDEPPNGGKRFAFAVASLRRNPLPPYMSGLLAVDTNIINILALDTPARTMGIQL
ncbi:hypothetical protein FACS189441_3050 [Betaproteobacteria bacterium]|nr:hypothetical protein FACS189441_3050 [Betaproteobacteria bacterium]